MGSCSKRRKRKPHAIQHRRPKSGLHADDLRPTMEELNQIELEFNKSKLAEYTIPAYSYVSVVELSNYMGSGEGDPYENPQVRARLYPELPNANMSASIRWIKKIGR